MTRSKQLLGGDFWPPRERPDSYQPPTSSRSLAGVTKHRKKRGTSHVTKLEMVETGRLSPEQESEDVGQSSHRNMGEQIGHVVQMTVEASKKLLSLEAKIDDVQDKLDNIMTFLGVEAPSSNSASKANTQERSRSQENFSEHVLQDRAVALIELEETQRAQRPYRREKNKLASKLTAERALSDALTTHRKRASPEELTIKDSDLQGLRRNLKVVSRYLNGT